MQARVSDGDHVAACVGGQALNGSVVSNGTFVEWKGGQGTGVKVQRMHGIGAKHEDLAVAHVHFQIHDGDDVGDFDDVNGRRCHGRIDDEDVVIHGQPQTTVVRVNGTRPGFEGQWFEGHRRVCWGQGLDHKVGDGGPSRQGPTGRESAGRGTSHEGVAAVKVQGLTHPPFVAQIEQR